MSMTQTIKRTDLDQFTGTEQWYEASILLRRRFLLTDGTFYLAKNGCHWLMDIVASVLLTEGAAFNSKAEGFSVWLIERVPEPVETAPKPMTIGAVLAHKSGYKPVRRIMARVSAWTDTPGKSTCLYTQDIEYTDFPFDELGERFEFYVEGIGTAESPWVALLKSEH